MDVPDADWQQAQLSQRFGGLGLLSLSLHSSAAFISSLASSGHGTDAITKCNAQVSPHDAIKIEVVIASPPSQRTLSKRLDTQTLLASSSPADNTRILSISAPHAGSWISVVPSPDLNLHLDPAECQVAITCRWWLGLDISGGSLCPFCPGVALDMLGHHAASCKHGGDVVARHNHLRDIFAAFCRRAHLSVKVEVGYGLGIDHVISLLHGRCS